MKTIYIKFNQKKLSWKQSKALGKYVNCKLFLNTGLAMGFYRIVGNPLVQIPELKLKVKGKRLK